MKKISMFDIPDEDERGVSPVIGVILMVAITVILAAVIASFVLGFGSSVQENVNAGATIDSAKSSTDGTVSVNWKSAGNADKLNVTLQWQANGTAITTKTINSVGGTVVFSEKSLTGVNATNDNKFRVVVKGIKGDTTSVVREAEVTV